MNLDKPKFGAACNGCGLCCQTELCNAGARLFPTASAPCPALLRDGERYRCGLVQIERKVLDARTIAEYLGIGCGCSMADDETTDAEIEAFDALSARMISGELPFQTSRD